MTVQKKILDLTGSQYLVQKVKSAINDVDSSLSTHIADTDIHVTTADKNKWNNQTYVFRYSSTALVASSTNSNTLLDNTDNLKVGDKVIDSSGVLFSITAIDTQNSTFTIGTALIDLAQDSDVVHKSGNEYITDTKTFGKGTLIVDNSSGSNVHGEIKLAGSRSGYIVADSGADGVFDSANCGISILLQDSGKPLHIGGYKVDVNGRVFADNTNKNPILSIKSNLIQTTTLVPENDSTSCLFRILSRLDYANGDASKTLDVRFQQNDDADATSAIYSYVNNKTSLGTAAKRWSGVYSTSYYYGNDNVEFSTKFVTTDTNQTISGAKTFSSTPFIYNSGTSGSTANLYFRNQLVTKGDTSTGGSQLIRFSDSSDKMLSRIQASKVSNGSTTLNLRADTVDTNNNDVTTEIQLISGRDGSKSLSPQNDNAIDLGRSLAKWKNLYINQINGLTPSSLGMPDLSNSIDISSYITDLAGSPNIYSPPANGYIVLRSTTANVLGIIENTTGMGSFSRGSNQVLAVNLPVVKNSSISIYVICTSLTHAKFIPCQGNV